MKTLLISAVENPESGTNMAAELICSGQLVAFPTETVYGLGADGLNPQAVRSIFEAKGRPADNPLILHISKKSEVKPLWAHVPKLAEPLMDAFWPGPLTLIFMRSSRVPDEVTAGLDTVAVRMPSNKTARLLIKKAGCPIAAPSANLSGRPSPTTAADVLADMDGRIPLILDGGACVCGVESTVLSLVGKPTILRPGAVTREMLEAVIGPVELAPSVIAPMKEGEVAASPGMKYKHYAPNARVYVVSGAPRACARRINELYHEYEAEGLRVCIAATNQTRDYYRGKEVSVLGDRDHPETLCAALFSALRRMDEHADVILAEGVDAKEQGLAYMNRVLRAAGFECEKV